LSDAIVVADVNVGETIATKPSSSRPETKGAHDFTSYLTIRQFVPDYIHLQLLIYLACRSCATAERVKIDAIGQQETIAECAQLVFSLHEGWAQLKECHCRRDWLKSSHK
jgi:hypothetical protein